ncbi:PLP-dependent aminotransferase family protein [Vreelandella maris]|uniref:PLP-dependent aminotransferase family protein n=1 Tax=Vreelandella maris TaxID=2729617 RepID=A0A7Y6RC71_9GAMM|nr:PLP-dependent aminotransferase family protein [Halomonas maris]NVF14196.1 PLP-dependent aminotransferase family protein [Halomonas maris]
MVHTKFWGRLSLAEGTYRYQQLQQWILQGIIDGRWTPGDRLPSIREICTQQGVSKATVQHALQRLEAQGFLEVRPKAGHFVTLAPKATAPPRTTSRIEAPRPVNVSDLLLDIMDRNAAFDLLPELHAGELPPGIVSLNRAIGRALRRQRGADFQYYDKPAGDLKLREQLGLLLAKRGWPVTPDELCITSGCQHALFLALMACCQRGDIVAVESPGFYGVLQLLEQLGLQVIEIPTSTASGLDMDALEEALGRWNIQTCVVSPAFATPGGALMSEAPRRRLMALAEEYDLAIIEDDIYAESGFSRVPDTLKALDDSNRVIHCSSFSKVLSRDLRLGWISGARWHQRILNLKMVTQLASSRYLQQGVAAYMEEGELSAHLRRQRKLMSEQRDRLLASLLAWPVSVRVTAPQGGLAFWLELPATVDTLAAYPKALDAGVVITPGPLFSASGKYGNCLRVSFSHPWDERRIRALNQLPELLHLT